MMTTTLGTMAEIEAFISSTANEKTPKTPEHGAKLRALATDIRRKAWPREDREEASRLAFLAEAVANEIELDHYLRLEQAGGDLAAILVGLKDLAQRARQGGLRAERFMLSVGGEIRRIENRLGFTPLTTTVTKGVVRHVDGRGDYVAFLNWQPGNGTRYNLMLMVTPGPADIECFQKGKACFVFGLLGGKTMVLNPDAVSRTGDPVDPSYLGEKLDLNEPDAVAVTQGLRVMLQRCEFTALNNLAERFARTLLGVL